jgi:L-amino acid N-acyltransferase YncA
MLLTSRKIVKEDYQAVKQIYEEGIQTGFATFEKVVPGWDVFNDKYLQHSRLVVLSNQEVIGWAALSPFSKREVYRGVAEVSIYVASNARGQGSGDYLLKRIIESASANGIWTLQAAIFRENVASIKLHKNNRFRLVGFREKIGQLDGVWKDNLLFEHRSKIHN